jgi:peptide/histidine transporter 3/4
MQRGCIVLRFVAGLFIMSVGSAAFKPNMTAMAKDQFDTNDPVEQKRGEPFFTTYYWNLSAVVVVIATIIVYIQTNVSYRVGFLVQGSFYLVGVLLFFCGTLLFR